MSRFAEMLQTGFQNSGYESEIWRPTSFLSIKAKSTLSGIGKWLGYIDKWILFPLLLRWRILNQGLNNPNVFFHICDHSNSPYLRHLPSGQTSITCHDVLAIRGALGHADAYCPPSSTGKFLQNWILTNLIRAEKIASVSALTLSQLNELAEIRSTQPKNWQVIHNGFNANFYPMSRIERNEILSKIGLKPDELFLLHVGSNLTRKNRKLLIDMVLALGDNWSGRICYAGHALDDDLKQYANSVGLNDRIISIVKPDHTTLIALYSACQSFIFPSLSEGFGWPVIEAQACGAPVIASNIEPLPEVSGETAFHADPFNPQEFAKAFLLLEDTVTKDNLIKQGYENCRRYEPSKMVKAYLNLFGVKNKEFVELS
ncbi:glycosyltransferase family 1 protein [Spirosoma sp. KCTC 42546]|uniref:glycosyltransferase family 4 protein n=1 Tax=Spirosoma sp. KCTC 42546 TaxID=2520506 RepID=UPI001FEDDE37|nr:glycosyltransferase family 1 protein [Spirosoma sp. KCTC 42546]